MTDRHVAHDDWDDDDAEGADEPEDYGDPDADEPTVPCPYCRREIHEDAQQCPYCEKYISAEDAPAIPQPVWIVLGVIACLITIYFWIFG